MEVGRKDEGFNSSRFHVRGRDDCFKVSFTLHLHKTFLGFELKKYGRRRVVYLNDKFK